MSKEQRKRVLIFGGTGSLGHKLTDRYLPTHDVCIYSRDETKQWLMKKEYNDTRINFVLGCVRNKQQVENAIFRFKPNIVIIASALKHIDQCEENINECVLTNITGVQNIIDISYEHSQKVNVPFLETVVMVSTDKSCSPVNVYGMSKAIAERMTIEKSQFVDKPKFVNVRYGNVLNSRGSVLPLFNKTGQNPKYKHFTVTDERMTRFFMTLDDSVDLIQKAISHGESGDTFIPKMKGYSILEIATIYSKAYKKSIKFVGLRPGEKLHECLINHIEIARTIDLGNVYVIRPCYREHEIETCINMEEYTSDICLESASNLEKYMELLDTSVDGESSQ